MTAALVIIAVITLATAAVALALRNLIHSALLLIASWFSIAAFYLWAGLPKTLPPSMQDDVHFAKSLLATYNVNVLPGSLLARAAGANAPSSPPVNPVNPGTGRIRMALVAPVEECLEAARRIAHFVESLQEHHTT